MTRERRCMPGARMGTISFHTPYNEPGVDMKPCVLCLIVLSTAIILAADGPTSRRSPALRIINGSTQTVDVFHIQDDGAGVPRGDIAPGKAKTIRTTIDAARSSWWSAGKTVPSSR